MNAQDANNKMMTGFESLDQYWKKNQLSLLQTLWIKTIVFFVFILKYTLRPLKRLFGKNFNPHKGLEQSRNEKIFCHGTKTFEKDGGNYLTQKEKTAFEDTGIHGPFKVFEREEAEALANYSHGIFQNKFDDSILIGQKVKKILEETNQANINYLGMFQALNYKRLWNAFTKKELTHKLASILGDDLLLWRSQYFHKLPGANGTFWHQTGNFRENSKKPKLTPTIKRHNAIIGLSVWIALTDSNKENGCLRIINSSYKDSRFEKFTYNIVADKLGFLMDQPVSEIENILKTLLFTPGNFLKVQMVYDYARKYIPNLFEDIKIFDLKMKAGEAVIFTSLNTHGSYPNTGNHERLALAGRITANDVRVYHDMEVDLFPTPKGAVEYPLAPIKCIQILGEDKFGYNRIADQPSDLKQ